MVSTSSICILLILLISTLPVYSSYDYYYGNYYYDYYYSDTYCGPYCSAAIGFAIPATILCFCGCGFGGGAIVMIVWLIYSSKRLKLPTQTVRFSPRNAHLADHNQQQQYYHHHGAHQQQANVAPPHLQVVHTAIGAYPNADK